MILVFGETNLTRRPFLFSIVKVQPYFSAYGVRGWGLILNADVLQADIPNDG
jgi:hypothetical protein